MIEWICYFYESFITSKKLTSYNSAYTGDKAAQYLSPLLACPALPEHTYLKCPTIPVVSMVSFIPQLVSDILQFKESFILIGLDWTIT